MNDEDKQKLFPAEFQWVFSSSRPASVIFKVGDNG
jgi:hypothetical protein